MAMRYLLFDLDGTLTDSAPGIINCAQYALEKMNIHAVPREELYPYIGPPLIYSFMHFHGLSQEQAEQAVVYYRERFAVKGWLENAVYEGIKELLQELREKEVILIVATSKPEEFAVRILKHFELAECFDFIAGNTLSEERPEKADVIAYVREKYPEIDCKNTVMIGDRKYDILGAHAQGLTAIGVLYGYGDREEMESVNADFVVEDVSALRKLLLTKTQ